MGMATRDEDNSHDIEMQSKVVITFEMKLL